MSDLLDTVAEDRPFTKIRELNDGRVIAIKQQPMPGGGWVATHEDITEQRRIEARIAHMAHHDALTDLPNRVLLRERLERALAGVHEDKSAAPCFASISTASRTSTTRSATRSAMPC